MREIRIFIDKEGVYEEVAQTTSYTGAKMMDGDERAYERIFTTQEDRSQLERFWDESCTAVCEKLKEFILEEKRTAEGFIINLGLSSAFEPALETAMKKEMFSFFVTGIVGKWYVFTNKGEAGEYVGGAAEMLEGIKRKACHRRKPKRPTRRI